MAPIHPLRNMARTRNLNVYQTKLFVLLGCQDILYHWKQVRCSINEKPSNAILKYREIVCPNMINIKKQSQICFL